MNYLSQYQPFNDKHELNEAVSDHLSRCKYDLNETDRDVLMMLSRYSVKYAGVSHLKVTTIANTVGKTKRTVQRTIRKLERLHIIETRSFLRKVTGGLGANIYVFLSPSVASSMTPRTSTETPTPVKDSAQVAENEPILFTNEKELLRNTSHKAPYKAFKDAVNTFAGNDSQPLVSKLYGVYLAQTKALKQAYEESELIDVAIQAINATMHASKRKAIRNVPGYYNGVISAMIDRMYDELIGDGLSA
ncbi:helix-turn-helix domain-containing protein [Virgibacillus necropolis]|uniref:Helix-turn-helix domain-containing protein n=1 Tax=Virgibacillus necropolis TaxID=163877 RepID=A0A221MCA1_9BACI|nr:helix-turn-helix domain-containing protein [Virgibacillus necropolis]ASN05298.1 helix-turn-helix domain-containing protein [Virgibacillus necropolis]